MYSGIKLMWKCTWDLQPMKILLKVLQVVGLGLGSTEYVHVFSGDSEKIRKYNINNQMQE